jgi:hypothetical protein
VFSLSGLCITFVFVMMVFFGLCIPSAEALSDFSQNNQGISGAITLWSLFLRAELHLGIVWDFVVEPIGSINLQKISHLCIFAPKFY